MVSIGERTSTTRASGVVVTTAVPVDVLAGPVRTRGLVRDRPPNPLVELLTAAPGQLELVDTFDVRVRPTPRGARSGLSPDLVELAVPGPGMALVLTCDEDTGLWHWHVPSTRADVPTARADAAAAPVDGAASFQVALDQDGNGRASRGLAGRIAGRVVSFAVCRLGEKLLVRGAGRLAEVFEERYRRGGLRWFRLEDYRRPRSGPEDQLGPSEVATLGAGPSLLFLHDALGQAHSGFARLSPELVGRLCAAYDDRVWAFDHHTLSQTPEHNAIELARRLAAIGAPQLDVDVIAHGRGGLVARELVERPPADSVISVRSVTFVATPNAGTPLGDIEHLGQLVERVTNLLAFIPGNPVTDVIDAVAVVVASVASRAAAGLVGLTALDPGGEYLAGLNAGAPRRGVTYRSMASDFAAPAGSGIGARLRDYASDQVFDGQPNDLIVPVASTHTASGRVLVADGDRHVFARPAAVDHASYWDHPDFDELIGRWLIPAAPSALPPAPAQPDPVSSSVQTPVVVATAPGSPDAAPAAAPDAVPEQGAPGGRTQVIDVTAVHGSLECAQHHVLVGHFLGTPIQGSEGFLDERLDRRLSARALLGQYPEGIGESVAIDTPRPQRGIRSGYPPGAIVVGLDRPGELTAEKLSATVSAALLQRAARSLEQRLIGSVRTEPPLLLRFSAVPIGTSGLGALSVDGAVAALVDAAVAANDQLHRHVDPNTGARAWDHVRVAGLEILELVADRAETVAHAVGRLPALLQAETGGHSEVRPADRLVLGEGRLPRGPRQPEHAGEWQRVIVRDLARESSPQGERRSGGATVLEFTAVGRRARADRMEVTIDDAAIEALVAGAVETAAPGDQVGNTLYELLLPGELKSDLLSVENIQLIVDEHTADLPWEALTAGLGAGRARELALRGGLLRQFRETEGARRDIRLPAGENALVIGNPPAGEDLAPLDGAVAEAAAMADLLAGQGFDVGALIWDGENDPVRDDFPHSSGAASRRVLDALFSREWRIVHVAAHGLFDPADSSRSGVVIGQGIAITPNVVRQLPVVPELVFLNCCYLGRMAGPRLATTAANRLAASVARELMRIGVRAVVAAGWAVDDDAAVLFATRFYERIGAGELFGTAVRDARKEVRAAYPRSMTWAAFQCYGDPGYALRSWHATPTVERTFVSVDELVRRLQTVSVLAGKIGLPDFATISRSEADLVAELDAYRRDVTEWGWDRPSVLYELGTAYAELGRYAEAVACYRRAWDDPTSNTAPVRLLEQLGNLEIRLAQRLARTDGPATAPAEGGGAETIARLRADAERHLGLALGLGATGERHALLASFHKKAATLAAGDDRIGHLRAACERYRAAHQCHMDASIVAAEDPQRGELRPYYTLNWLQMASLGGGEVPQPEAAAFLAAIAADPTRPMVGEPVAPSGIESDMAQDFWARVTLADLALTRAVLDGVGDLEVLESSYREAFRTRSSRRDRDTVVDHLRDIADIRADPGLHAVADRLDDRSGGPPD